MGVTATDLFGLANYLNPNPVDTPVAPRTPDGTVAYGRDYWTALIEGLEDGITNLDGKAVQPLNAAWQGVAAELATQKVAKTGQNLVSSANQLNQVRSLLDAFWKQISSLADQLSSKLANQDFFTYFCTVTNAGGGTVTYQSMWGNDQMVAQTLAELIPAGLPGPPDSPQPAAGSVSSALTAAGKYVNSGGQLTGAPGQAQALTALADALASWRVAATNVLRDLVADANNLDTRVADNLLDLLPDAPYAPPAGSLGARFVTVAPGQSLSAIAQKVYGDPGKWTLIADSPANSWITDPNAIPAGKQVWVPPIPGKPVSAVPATPPAVPVTVPYVPGANPQSVTQALLGPSR